MPIFEKQQIIDPALFVDNKLVFMNPQTGRLKLIKVGFCFPGFIFDCIVLFVKGFTGHGLIVLGFYIITFIMIDLIGAKGVIGDVSFGQPPVKTIVSLTLWIGWLGMKTYIGVFANLWQAKDLLARGWILQNATAAKETLNAKNWQLG